MPHGRQPVWKRTALRAVAMDPRQLAGIFLESQFDVAPALITGCGQHPFRLFLSGAAQTAFLYSHQCCFLRIDASKQLRTSTTVELQGDRLRPPI